MKTFAERLKWARKQKGLSQVDIQRQTGINQQTMHKIEHGLIQSTTYILELADICGVNPHWLKSGRGSPYGISSFVRDARNYQTILVPLLTLDELPHYTTLSLSSNGKKIHTAISEKYVREELLALQVKGDAMASPDHVRFSLCDKDIVIVGLNLKPSLGDVVIASINDNLKIRQYVDDGTEIILKPFNAHYPTLTLKEEDKILAVILQKIVSYVD